MGAMFSRVSLVYRKVISAFCVALHTHPMDWVSRKPLPSDRVIPPKWLGDSTPCIFDKMTLWTDCSQKKKLQPAAWLSLSQHMPFAFKGYNHLNLPIVIAQYNYAEEEILLNEISSNRNIIKWTFANLQHYKQEYARLRQQIINLQNSSRFSFYMKSQW